MKLLNSGDRLLRRLKWPGEKHISLVFGLMYSNGSSLAKEQEELSRRLQTCDAPCHLRIGFYVYMSKTTKTTSGSFWIAKNKKKKGEEALLSRLSGAQENKRHHTVA